MRISDTERQRTIDELRRHCAAGRIDVDEYADRIEKVMGASTFEELDTLLHDLPMLRIADPSNGERSGADPRVLVSTVPLTGRRRIFSAVAVMMAVAIVIAAAALLAVVSWGWAAVLLVGWIAGLVQAAMMRRRHTG